MVNLKGVKALHLGEWAAATLILSLMVSLLLAGAPPEWVVSYASSKTMLPFELAVSGAMDWVDQHLATEKAKESIKKRAPWVETVFA